MAALTKLGWTPAIIWECETRKDSELRSLLMKVFGLRQASNGEKAHI
jgi:G:T-mismatch repair DNA endonuclease (very short patch repair protein)